MESRFHLFLAKVVRVDQMVVSNSASGHPPSQLGGVSTEPGELQVVYRPPGVSPLRLAARAKPTGSRGFTGSPNRYPNERPSVSGDRTVGVRQCQVISLGGPFASLDSRLAQPL